MPNSPPTEPIVAPSVRQEADWATIQHADPFSLPVDSGSPWNITTVVALSLLVVLWVVKLYTTWGAWGNLTIDSGHEMYVPALLAEGKQLYRDAWFVFGPAAPYFNSYLFRLFGLHLNVLYWAGSLSALGSAVFLFLAGMRLSSWAIGWTAGAVVLAEAFSPSLFCFPLPYSFSAVYGCMIGCLFLWLLVNATTSNHWSWVFGAGTAAAVALLLKPEFGLAAYATLTLLVATRGFLRRSWRSLASDVAAVLPGVVLCGMVILWMVSIAGVNFITQENIQSWPTSYFMKTYGKAWLAHTGFVINADSLHSVLFRAVPVAAGVLVVICVLWWERADLFAVILKSLSVLLLISYIAVDVSLIYPPPRRLEAALSILFFPSDMVLYVIVAAIAAWGYFCYRRRSRDVRHAAFPLLLTFSSLLAFRILMKMAPEGYSIYYNGPAVFCFLLLLFLIIPRSGRLRRFVFLSEFVFCLGCLTPVFLHARQLESDANHYVPLTTERGTIRVSKHMAENYAAGIQFMKEKASQGQSVLSVPEDTSLYFLSGTHCPTRVYLFIPGSLAPGKMTKETIRELDEKPVRYLLWSNRTFSEYGVPVFGKDFDREFGDYLKSHYRRVGPLIPNTGAYWDWTADVWERRADPN